MRLAIRSARWKPTTRTSSRDRRRRASRGSRRRARCAPPGASVGRARGARPGRRADAERAIGDGKVVELGAQWVGPTQDRVLRADRASSGSRRSRPTPPGINLFERGGKIGRYSGTIPRTNPVGLAEVGLAMRRLNAMAREVPLEAPWRRRRRERWDSQTFATWMRAQRPHRRRPRHPAPGDHRRLGRRAAGRLAAARPLLHPLGRLARAPHRRRGRRPAGPRRRRHRS